MKRIRNLSYLLFALLMLIPLTIGQDDADVIEPKNPDMVNPAANISYPPPVYVVRNSVDIRGTVTLATMRNFFIEFRPLVLDMMMDDEEEDRQWFPATFPRIEAVEDDVLGTWNTVTWRDGLYELRLTINTGGEMPEYFRVSPIRVENNPPSYAAEQQVIAEPEPTATPEPPPTPVDTTPRVVATVNSNVRAGDSTLYAVIGHLLDGESAKIKGVSSYSSGWYYIELANGRRGFIFPGIVTTEGDLSNLPRINPPPLPPTPIPVPTAIPATTAPAATGADLVMQDISIDPFPFKCGVASRISMTVKNQGTGPAVAGHILVRDTRQVDYRNTGSTEIGYVALRPGDAQEVFGHLTVNTYVGEEHNFNLILDGHNTTAESNENNNRYASAPYTLRSC